MTIDLSTVSSMALTTELQNRYDVMAFFGCRYHFKAPPKDEKQELGKVDMEFIGPHYAIVGLVTWWLLSERAQQNNMIDYYRHDDDEEDE